MKIWNAFKVAFSMYSRIPVGKADWTEENMKYSMCFVPLVGLVIAAFLVLWHFLNIKLGFNDVLDGGIRMVIPLCITGGIHMDGFCDVVDALSSYRTTEKRLEILKDPHAGAFAVMWGCAYMILEAGLLAQVQTTWGILLCGTGFILSRALACFLAITLKSANRNGTLYAFTSTQQKGTVSSVLMLYIILGALTICIFNLTAGLLAAGFGFFLTVWFVRMADRQFGGMTGDMAGFYIQIYELMIFAVVVFTENLAVII